MKKLLIAMAAAYLIMMLLPCSFAEKLPTPKYESNVSVEKALLTRRSIRDYKDEPLTLGEVSQLLWAAQGITDRRGFRTAPSAGATYPLEVYIVVGNVTGLSQGIYRYKPHENELIKVVEGDKRAGFYNASFGQTWVKKGAIIIVFSATYERTTNRYGQRGIRYVDMEAGHAVQNVYLQAASLNLGTVVIGAFDDDKIKKIMSLKDNERPVCFMPVGRR